MNILVFQENEKACKHLVYRLLVKFKTIFAEWTEHYWISGCKKDGDDRLYGERIPIHIDEDVREEYWKDIRNRPNNTNTKAINTK
ncbi:hypothetical protein [Pedobacter kyonggii]|uniref:Uncharacterized protein n=1 Tax=Pedobacter kyonggii TaxID=1926871 RepID=A0A4Q9HCF2_9SPHI|nr:hypothetical protein [Pedobacter kyonggii]TBO42088.1 hypothetical protein EYS08_11170 [Pedobacter kyonggii]